MKMPEVMLLRSQNRIVVEPTTPAIRQIVEPALTFLEKEFLYGKDLYDANRNGRLPFEENLWECFVDDHKGRIATSYGFSDRLTVLLKKAGYTVREKNLTPHKNPKVFEPLWDHLFDSGVVLKERQDEFLAKLVTYDNGRFDCPTGWGKSFLLRCICKLLPTARIAIVSKRLAILRDQIYPELRLNLPSVGLVCSGKRDRGKRVMCFSAGCLPHLVADDPYDIIVFDECHEAGSDYYATQMGLIPGQPRMYGLSATMDMRMDGKDMRVEGMFGPVRMKVHYQEAVAAGGVAPIEVRFRKVILDVDPCGDRIGTDKLRHGVWSNDYRNDLIVKDATSYPADPVMVYVKTLEHALRLLIRFQKKGVNPPLIYSERELPPAFVNKLRGWNLPIDDLPEMTVDRRAMLTRQARDAEIPIFISTDVLGVGFSSKRLSVLVRGDAGGSRIADSQVPGRTSRTHEDKEFAIIHDYVDKFNRGMNMKSDGRKESYKALRWKIKTLDTPLPGSLREKMLWG